MLEFGFQPPELDSVMQVVKYSNQLNMPIYVGLDDEGMAVKGGTFRSTGLDKEKTVKALQSFNRHQDFEKLVEETGWKN